MNGYSVIAIDVFHALFYYQAGDWTQIEGELR
jgi:hypothetical protein